MENPNYYHILGVSRTASHKEIVQAYRRLAHQIHPDHQPMQRKTQASEQMKLLNEAYAVLGNAEERARYDATFHLAKRRHRRPRSNRWRKLWEVIDFGLWLIVIGFLITGAYLMVFEWGHIFNSPSLAGNYVSQWVLAGVWYAMFVATLFRLGPKRR